MRSEPQSLMAIALVASALVLVALSTQIEADPPPEVARTPSAYDLLPTKPAVDCSPGNIDAIHVRIARMKRAGVLEEAPPAIPPTMNIELVKWMLRERSQLIALGEWRANEIATEVGRLRECGRSTEVDPCRGYDPYELDHTYWEEGPDRGMSQVTVRYKHAEQLIALCGP